MHDTGVYGFHGANASLSRPVRRSGVRCADVTEFTPVHPLIDTTDSDRQRRMLLSAFLAEHRRRIAPETEVLGDHERGAQAIGKMVSPGELADASGVNRRWYELAESGAPTRTSTAIVRALTSVFRLDEQQQGVLTQLTTPSLDRDTPRDESLDVRDAFASMRWYLRKLRSCSSTDEVLSAVEETAAANFPETPYLTTAFRCSNRSWMFHGEPIGRSSQIDAFNRCVDDVVLPIFEFGDTTGDELMCFPQASAPGELLTYFDYDDTRLAGILKDAYAGFKQLHEPMLAAVIRSRGDFVAHLYLADFLKLYDTEVDRAVVSALAEFASLAIAPSAA
jgi:hypothetical protein